MPRQRCSDNQETESDVLEGRCREVFEYDDCIDIALLPDADNSDAEVEFQDDDEDSEIETEGVDEHTIMSYRQVYDEYSKGQKFLEGSHQYSWADGEQAYNNQLKNEYFLKNNDKKIISESSPTKIFEFFFSKSIKEYIIEASAEKGLKFTLSEMNIFLGIIIFSTFNKRTSERDYWSTDPLLECSIVKSRMSRNRFLEIKTGLKCAKNKDENAKDPAWRVRTILEKFKSNAKCYGYFQTALSVDEMMVKFKGRLIFRQYIRNKPVRFGIKMWALCGSDGYVFECDIYCGKNSQSDGKLANCALGSRVVMNMTEKFLLATPRKKLEKYHLYFDNYFASPDLTIHLQKIGLKSTGTVKQNRVKVNNKLDKNVPRGTMKVVHEKNSGLNYITLMDSKEVSLLSTAAGVNPLKNVKRYSKEKKGKDDIPMPDAFSNYNKYMGGVDIHDQYCSALLPIFRSKKWTWVVLMRVIQSSIANAVILYNAVRENKKKMSAKDFAMEIVRNYLIKESSSALKSHKLETQKKRKYCSNDICEIRTRSWCENCSKYFCKECFAKFHM